MFPVSTTSGSLADLMRFLSVTIKRIGPDVVRVRREA